MTRAGLLLMALLAAASVGVFAQDSNQSASAPPQVSSQSTQGSAARQPGTAQQSSSSEPTAQQEGTSQNAASNDVNASQQLPQTSTILPLLGLIGLGSLVAGLFARR
jgi:hypothetical protein